MCASSHRGRVASNHVKKCTGEKKQEKKSFASFDTNRRCSLYRFTTRSQARSNFNFIIKFRLKFMPLYAQSKQVGVLQQAAAYLQRSYCRHWKYDGMGFVKEAIMMHYFANAENYEVIWSRLVASLRPIISCTSCFRCNSR